MLRSILAILAGYVTMILGVTSTLAILFFAVRDELPREPGPFTGPQWILWVEIASSLAVAVLGGYVCALVARRREVLHGLVLAGIVLALGLLSAAMESGMKPMWSSIGVMLAGVLGVIAGARWRASHVALLR
ncbi:MAG TPA: hypothetical protein VG755_18275 [Nannocystaceae bacterium]|nr:hypothetical protein [Nannocystaceae bacterium]